jgi:uncharacterized SAM-binding protein YcdF (DUF218 family)/glycosyltransferase involved in cell wall biosynthesis
MLKGQTVLCISSIDWDFIWQGHQQIMSTLAAHGNSVLFIENTGARRPTLRDMPRLRHRLINWWRGTKGFRQEQENLFVYSPLVLPFPYSRLAQWINRFIMVRALRRWMSAIGGRRPLVWTFLPTPLAVDLINAVDPELVVYYCIDDIEASSRGARNVRRTEDRLFRDAHLVFVTSERLRARARQFREQVDIFPFGVNFAHFEAARLSNGDTPPELDPLPRPIVGYVGGLHRWVDQELVAGAARQLTEATFVFVGPPQCDLSTLEREPTVRLLGPRAHNQLPSYIKGFDVAIVPYVSSEYTANVYPTKLNEYLAMGVPVVATGLPEIRRFNQVHGDVVAIADNATEFAARVRDAIGRRSEAEIRRRIDVARENSWEMRIDQMSAVIENAVAARSAHLENWDTRLRRIYGKAAKPVRAAAIVALVYLVLFHTPLLWLVAEPLRLVDMPRQANVIVVFAGGAGESGTTGEGYQERVRQAVDLYRAGHAPRMIFSSGFVYVFKEAEVMRALATDLGVPAEAIVLEQRGGNTHEMVVFASDVARRYGTRVLLVSSPYHMRRALLTWRRQAPDIEVTATPVPNSRFYVHESGATLQQYRAIAWEYAAIAFYRMRGWL